jgi:uncharacterized protein YgbK (DUF1537 family)
VLALADDATGALEAGAQFAAQDIETLVAFRGSPAAFPSSAAAVIDTETRHAPAGEAREAVRSWTREARRRGIASLYKKTDSTLRGNIAAEFAGMLEAYPEASLVYVPAYPKLSRRVRGGRLYIGELPLTQTHFTRDLRNPVREDHIPDLLMPEVGCAVRSVTPATFGPRLSRGERLVLVCDSETDADLHAIADTICNCGRPLIAAGPGGFAGIWARRLPTPRISSARVLPRLPCLVVNGSLHPLSLVQAGGAGCTPHELPGASPSRIAAEIRSTGFAVLTTTDRQAGDGLAICRRLASTALAVLHAVEVRTVVIFGGDTAIAILDELNVDCVRPVGELQDGVPVSVIRTNERDTAVITKAGGFGDADTLAIIRHILEQQT